MELINYSHTINRVMEGFTQSSDRTFNVHRFIDICDMIWFIEPKWKTPLKIESIAELITNEKLVMIGDIIMYKANKPSENCAIYVKDGTRVTNDDMYLMGLLGD